MGEPLKRNVRAHRVLERQQRSARLVAIATPRGDTGSEWGLAYLKELGFPLAALTRFCSGKSSGERYNPSAREQSLAADGAIACFSRSRFPISLSADRAPQLKAGVGHLHMNISKLSPILLILLLATCVKPPVITPASQAEADKAIDHEQARKLSDSIADNLLKNDRPMLRNAMEKGFRDYYDDTAFASLIDQMFALYGKPLDVEYKMDELGRKTGTGGYDKPMRKFWYATRTTKYEKGTVFLTVEVVPDEGHLASSGVALVTFPVRVPPALK